VGVVAHEVGVDQGFGDPVGDLGGHSGGEKDAAAPGGEFFSV